MCGRLTPMVHALHCAPQLHLLESLDSPSLPLPFSLSPTFASASVRVHVLCPRVVTTLRALVDCPPPLTPPSISRSLAAVTFSPGSGGLAAGAGGPTLPAPPDLLASLESAVVRVPSLTPESLAEDQRVFATSGNLRREFLYEVIWSPDRSFAGRKIFVRVRVLCVRVRACGLWGCGVVGCVCGCVCMCVWVVGMCVWVPIRSPTTPP